MPGAELVSVVAEAGRPREGPEVVVVARGPRRAVVVVPWGWTSARLMPPPRGVVAARMLRGRAVAIRVVAGCEDGPRDIVQQLRRGFTRRAVGDVPRAYQHHGGARWRHRDDRGDAQVHDGDGRAAALPLARGRDRGRPGRHSRHEPGPIHARGRRIAAGPGDRPPG